MIFVRTKVPVAMVISHNRSYSTLSVGSSKSSLASENLDSHRASPIPANHIAEEDGVTPPATNQIARKDDSNLPPKEEITSQPTNEIAQSELPVEHQVHQPPEIKLTMEVEENGITSSMTNRIEEKDSSVANQIREEDEMAEFGDFQGADMTSASHEPPPADTEVTQPILEAGTTQAADTEASQPIVEAGTTQAADTEASQPIVEAGTTQVAVQADTEVTQQRVEAGTSQVAVQADTEVVQSGVEVALPERGPHPPPDNQLETVEDSVDGESIRGKEGASPRPRGGSSEVSITSIRGKEGASPRPRVSIPFHINVPIPFHPGTNQTAET